MAKYNKNMKLNIDKEINQIFLRLVESGIITTLNESFVFKLACEEIEELIYKKQNEKSK